MLAGLQLVPAVTELVISELLWLNYVNVEKPVYLYVHSQGSQTPLGEVSHPAELELLIRDERQKNSQHLLSALLIYNCVGQKESQTFTEWERRVFHEEFPGLHGALSYRLYLPNVSIASMTISLSSCQQQV